ncbi:hypothetical protein AVEN_113154-1 [Araneus ventricosus]|uniref:Uncharacterized protein n=1 Tax=Araneus ventricosus TaxID=182803 RepID=A0A4Y2NGD8_ARAVE|nr:hypothetical protein AVEN_113154-1 [Araneus ventricosus]
MKSLTYETTVDSAEDLVVRIVVAADKINTTPGIFEKVRQSFLRRSPSSLSPSGRHRSSAPSSSNSSHSSDSRFISVLDKDAKETPESTQTGQNATDNEVIDNSKVMKHSKVIIHRPRNEEEMIAWVLKGAVKQPEEPENIRLYDEDMRKFKQSRKLRYE